MAAQIEFYEDANGTKPLGTDLGVGIIGRERVIYAKNIGDTYLRDISIKISYPHMQGLDIFDLAPGETKPAISWNPPAGIDEQEFKGNISVNAISYVK
jgi:hypothetical protein